MSKSKKEGKSLKLRKLTSEEMLTMDLNQEKKKNAEANVIALDKDIIKANADIDLLKIQINLKVESISKLKAQKELLRTKAVNQAEVGRNYAKALGSDIGVPDDTRWGWNPDTGEVVVDEEDKGEKK